MQLVSNVPPGLALMSFVIPGFRCAPPWAIFPRSLRELSGPLPRVITEFSGQSYMSCSDTQEHKNVSPG